MSKEQIGTHIREARRAKHLSQAALTETFKRLL